MIEHIDWDIDISNMTTEERLKDVFAFMIEGITALAQEGTRAAAEGKMALARERFAGAAAILQVGKYYTKLLPELTDCVEYMNQEGEHMTEIINQTAMLACSAKGGVC